MKAYQICTNCILDTSEPLITFDEKGICNYCNDYKELQHNVFSSLSQDEKQKMLDNFILKIKEE